MIINLSFPRRSFWLAGFFLLFFGACQSPNAVEKTNSTQSYADNFSIEKFADYQLITIKKPWANATQSLRYALYPRQHPRPKLPPDVLLIAVPVQKIACTSTAQVAMLDFVQQTDKIVALSDGKYIYNQIIFNKLAKGEIIDLGNDQSFSYEKLLTAAPDITLVFGLNSESKTAKKLGEMGQNVFYIAEFLETSPLGRAEWVKVVAALLGDEVQQKADILFRDSVEIPYNQIKTQIDKNGKKPTVLTGLAYEGIWYVAGGESFLAKLIADAGGDYLYKNQKTAGSVPFAFEKVYAEAQQADIWLNVSEAQSLDNLKKANALYADFAAFQSKKVFSYHKKVSPNGGFDIFESAILRPHLVLADFYQIIHNQSVDNLHYYQQLE